MAIALTLLLTLGVGQLAHAQVTALAYSSDGSVIVWGELQGRLKLVDSDTGQDVWQKQAHDGGVYGIAVSPKGTLLASCGPDKKVKLWKLTGRPNPSAQEVTSLVGHEGAVLAVAFSPDGRLLASGGYDKTIRLWDVESGKLLAKLDGHESTITSLAFSPNSAILASAGTMKRGLESDRIRLWDLNTHKLFQALPHRAQQIAFIPESPYLISLGHSEITMWHMARGRNVFQCKEFHRSMAVSADGKWLATGLGTELFGNGVPRYHSSNGVKLWEIVSGKLVQSPPTDLHLILRDPEVLAAFRLRDPEVVVALSSDGSSLAIGHWGGHVSIQKLEEPNGKLDSEKLETLWDMLAGGDAHVAYKAIGAVVARKGTAVSFIKKELQPVRKGDDVKRLIGNLDSERFTTRDAAQREILRLGNPVEMELRQALQAKPSLETARRIELLLRALPLQATPDELRQTRAVVVLGRIGTDEARHHLEVLAKGQPSAWLTQEAQSCLRHLPKR